MYRTAIILWLHEFFLAISPMFALFSAFMLESGLSPMMIAICLSLFFITMSICELPSSLIADKYSRKKVLILSDIHCIIGSAVMLLSHSHITFMICLILTAIGAALKSGTIEALLYDEMKHKGNEGKFPKAYGIYQSATLIGIATGLIISSYVAQYGYNLLITMAIIGIMISISIMTFAVNETPKSQLITKNYSFTDILLEAKHTVCKNPVILYTVFIIITYASIVWSFGDIAIVASMSLGWEKEKIARIFSYLTFFNIIILFVATKYISKLTVKIAHIILICVVLLACIGMSFGAWWSIFCISPIWWCSGINDIAIRAHVQKNAVSSSRATTTSVISLMTGLCYIISTLLIGIIATYCKYSISITTVSFITGCILIFLLFRIRKLQTS